MKIKYVTETILCLGWDLSPGPPARQSSTVPNELKDQPSRNVICQQLWGDVLETLSLTRLG